MNLRGELVTPVAEALRALNVPFALSSAYDRPELIGGELLQGVSNVGKPVRARDLIKVLGVLPGILAPEM